MKLMGYIAHMEQMRNVYKILVRPEGINNIGYLPVDV
jgi:hypothetical protein